MLILIYLSHKLGQLYHNIQINDPIIHQTIYLTFY